MDRKKTNTDRTEGEAGSGYLTQGLESHNRRDLGLYSAMESRQSALSPELCAELSAFWPLR